MCRGVYADNRNKATGLELYHIAARLRAHAFNYISLETALSDAGVISQIPLQWITLMSSGRSQIIDCGNIGHIEFIQKLETRLQLLNHDTAPGQTFQQEMLRFLPAKVSQQSIAVDGFWQHIQQTVNDACATLTSPNTTHDPPFTL